MKKWVILNKKLNLKSSSFAKASADKQKLDTGELVKVLLANRGIKTKEQIQEFLNPKLENLTAKSLGINKSSLAKSLKRIEKAILKKEKIVVFGDYDVDGVCGVAILWETLNGLGASVMPYIPHRIEEGYGLSKKGIDNLRNHFPNTSLIITVDNGIVATSAVEYANNLGIDVIITDHHVPGENLPKAYSIVHSTKICGAAVAWFLSRSLVILSETKDLKDSSAAPQNDIMESHLGLVALATVADVMKLNGFNRTVLIHGLRYLRKTERPGLTALFKLATIDPEKIGVYEIGHIIAPRLNAMGRIEHAMDSLRLICTNNKTRAEKLAQKLNSTNLERQQMTLDSFLHAKGTISEKTIKKILFIAHESYEPGVIGLIAGKLTEEFYRPSIVLSIGKEYSKASARSVAGFNIIEFIRLSSNLLVDAGGHPMAAGFTVETKNISKLQRAFEKLAEEQLKDGLLVRKLKIDCELELDLIDDNLFEEIQKLSPFGQGNPEPTFLAKNVLIEDMRYVGVENKHLKVQIRFETRSDLNLASNEGRTLNRIGGIMFGYDQSLGLKIGDKVDIVYTISENEWLAQRSFNGVGNGNKKIELKIKDIKRVN